MKRHYITHFGRIMAEDSKCTCCYCGTVYSDFASAKRCVESCYDAQQEHQDCARCGEPDIASYYCDKCQQEVDQRKREQNVVYCE